MVASRLNHARRWEELESWNSEGVDQPVITKTVMVSIIYKMNNEQWREEQLKDPDISLIIKLIQSKEIFIHKAMSEDRPESKNMMRHKQQFIIQNSLPYKKCKNLTYDTKTMQFVYPNPTGYEPTMMKSEFLGRKKSEFT